MKWFLITLVLAVAMIAGQFMYMTKLEVLAGRLNVGDGDWIEPCKVRVSHLHKAYHFDLTIHNGAAQPRTFVIKEIEPSKLESGYVKLDGGFSYELSAGEIVIPPNSDGKVRLTLHNEGGTRDSEFWLSVADNSEGGFKTGYIARVLIKS